MSAATTTSATTTGTVAHLPDDPVVLKRMLEELLDTLRRRDHELQHVQARLDQLLRRLYGPRSERLDPRQLLFFAERTAADAPPPPASPPPDASAAKRRRHPHGRQRPPAHLVRERRVHELSAAQRLCPCCGQTRQVIGEDVSTQYECVPQSLFVIEHVRLKYACVDCEQRRRPQRTAAATATGDAVTPLPPVSATNGGASATTTAVPDRSGLAEIPGHAVLPPTQVTLVTAPLPQHGVPRCLAAPGLLAQVIVSKFGDHLPLYRQAQQFARQGVSLTRSTLCDWLKRAADLVTPLCHLMTQEVLRSLVLQSDDTPVSVQDSSRDDTRKGRVWVYLGDVAHPYTVYAYSPNREQGWPLTFLASYTGILQADAYSGYDRLFASGRVVEAGCWAHARRKFFEAQTTDPARASYVLGVVRQLYAVEKQAREESARLGLPLAESWALRLRLRQEQSVPLLTTLCQWLEKERDQVLPKSPISEALTYARNQWQALLRYTTRGFLEIDNNAAERALRAVAVGRKNYLFFGSDVGGQTAAVWYSLVQTCKRLGIEPWRYLRDVLERLPTCPAEGLGELLPDRWAAAQRAALAGTVPVPPDTG
jgi:transposase